MRAGRETRSRNSASRRARRASSISLPRTGHSRAPCLAVEPDVPHPALIVDLLDRLDRDCGAGEVPDPDLEHAAQRIEAAARRHAGSHRLPGAGRSRPAAADDNPRSARSRARGACALDRPARHLHRLVQRDRLGHAVLDQAHRAGLGQAGRRCRAARALADATSIGLPSPVARLSHACCTGATPSSCQRLIQLRKCRPNCSSRSIVVTSPQPSSASVVRRPVVRDRRLVSGPAHGDAEADHHPVRNGARRLGRALAKRTPPTTPPLTSMPVRPAEGHRDHGRHQRAERRRRGRASRPGRSAETARAAAPGASTIAHSQCSWPMLHSSVPGSAPSTANFMQRSNGSSVGGDRERPQQRRQHRPLGHAARASGACWQAPRAARFRVFAPAGC